MPTPRILAFAGSTRSGSFNKKLVRIAADAARAAGAEVTLLDLAEHRLPLYDGDLESSQGLPPEARRLKDIFLAHDALLISAPEYNSSITAVLKNTIDWVSRPVHHQPPLAEFDGKVAGLLSASPGALGGLRGLVHLRAILSNIKVLVIPQQHAVSHASEAFDEDGALKDPRAKAAVDAVAERLVAITTKLHA